MEVGIYKSQRRKEGRKLKAHKVQWKEERKKTYTKHKTHTSKNKIKIGVKIHIYIYIYTF